MSFMKYIRRERVTRSFIDNDILAKVTRAQAQFDQIQSD